jgi:hypothetical protein
VSKVEEGSTEGLEELAVVTAVVDPMMMEGGMAVMVMISLDPNAASVARRSLRKLNCSCISNENRGTFVVMRAVVSALM